MCSEHQITDRDIKTVSQVCIIIDLSSVLRQKDSSNTSDRGHKGHRGYTHICIIYIYIMAGGQRGLTAGDTNLLSHGH